ncbi:hypothetical protein [Actinoplanes sp. NPDC051851]|uniref:hypothetical protein n=1 Tax=Actinoplanes sp. NPDC051851 TaxID=3154753 RepID=UPI0034346806
MEYLERTSPVMALAWMTPLEQLLGLVCREGVWRVRWVRIDPLAEVPGLLVSVHEEDLAGDVDALDPGLRVRLDPGLPPPSSVVVPDDGAALRWAEEHAGARDDRWVNPAVDGWRVLCAMRGHP